MKIVYLHQYFNTPNMSGSTRSFEMARRLVAAGHEVQMITADRGQVPNGSSGRKTIEAGINVNWINIPYSNHMTNGQRLKAFAKYAARATSQACGMQPDIVFATSTPLTIALPGVISSKRRQVPLVFEVRDLWPALPIAVGALRNPVVIRAARMLEKFAYKNSNHIVALSPGMKQGIVDSGFPEARVTVIPNSCDVDLFDIDWREGVSWRAKQEWLGASPLVVYIGTIGRINGVEYLAKLAASTARLDSDVKFLVVGSGAEEDKVRSQASELGVLNRNFFMLPPVPKNEVPKILSAATISTSLFTDVKEMEANSANKFFDSMAAGKPIAINYGGWHAEMLDKKNGLYLDRDVEIASVKLVAAIRSADWLENAGEWSKSHRNDFSRDRLASQFEQVLLTAAEYKKN